MALSIANLLLRRRVKHCVPRDKLFLLTLRWRSCLVN
jgi:hypothetical protein